MKKLNETAGNILLGVAYVSMGIIMAIMFLAVALGDGDLNLITLFK